MLKQDKQISDILHYEITDTCGVCNHNSNMSELFLKFHANDLKKEY